MCFLLIFVKIHKGKKYSNYLEKIKGEFLGLGINSRMDLYKMNVAESWSHQIAVNRVDWLANKLFFLTLNNFRLFDV